jgi:hypothetical protein
MIEMGIGMSSIAIGGLGPFLKQPALPHEAPQTKKKKKKILRQCIRLFQKSDPNPQCLTSHHAFAVVFYALCYYRAHMGP